MSLFCRNFSTQIGVSAATTAVLARSSASLMAVPPVIHPPQAELTHLCPLGCPYCSNPIALESRVDENASVEAFS